MDDNLQELYQDIILEHNRNPHNKHDQEGCATCRDGYNPSCGDRVNICIKLKNDILEEVTFSGEGCAISQASASLMTDLLKGKTKAEAVKIIQDIQSALRGDDVDLSQYGEVCALSGVKRFPMRIKCATLAWHAAESLLVENK